MELAVAAAETPALAALEARALADGLHERERHAQCYVGTSCVRAGDVRTGEHFVERASTTS